MDKNTKINEMEITDEFIFAKVDETAKEIADKLLELSKESAHGSVLVTGDKKEVIGFITSKDIINHIATDQSLLNKTAAEILNTDFMEVSKDDTLGNIIPTIAKKYPNAVVVIDTNRQCVGYFSKNDYKDALAILGVYDKSHKPETKGDWRTRGIAMSSLGKKSAAIKCYEKSVKKSANQEKGWTDLAKRLERINKLKDAISCYDKALEINSNNDEALTSKGKIYSQEKTDNLAIQNYKKALEKNPNNIEALMNMSMEQATIGAVEEAMRYFEKVVELKGNTPELWLKKGHVYDKAKKFEESLECYNKATSMNEWLEDAWYDKCVTLNRLGKDQDALQCLIKILQINPTNEDARECLNSYKTQGALKMY